MRRPPQVHSPGVVAYAHPMPEPLASWNESDGVWETPETHLCGHQALYAEAFPMAGSLRSRKVYDRPALARQSGRTPLMPTPMVDDAKNVTRDSGALPSLARTARSL